jgi:hypothetical protein
VLFVRAERASVGSSRGKSSPRWWLARSPNPCSNDDSGGASPRSVPRSSAEAGRQTRRPDRSACRSPDAEGGGGGTARAIHQVHQRTPRRPRVTATSGSDARAAPPPVGPPTILPAGGMDHRHTEQPSDIDEHVALASGHLLACLRAPGRSALSSRLHALRLQDRGGRLGFASGAQPHQGAKSVSAPLLDAPRRQRRK